LFYDFEQLETSDLQTGFSSLNTSFISYLASLLYSAENVILSGLVSGADSPADGGISLSAGAWVQSGQYATFPGGSVNIVSTNSGYYGSGLPANATYPRIDLVCISYQTAATSTQSRNFETGISPRTVATQLVDSFAVQVVHGTPSSSPVAPSPPAGYLTLCQVYVAANATTISGSNITDETAQYRTDGGRLSLTTAGLLAYKSATELSTPAGFKLDVGTGGAYLQENTTSSRLDIVGDASGVSVKSPTFFTYSGTSLVIQPTVNASSGTHMLSMKNASGTEYFYVDNNGNIFTQGAPSYSSPAVFGAGLHITGLDSNSRSIDLTSIGVTSPYLDSSFSFHFPNAASGDYWQIADRNGATVLKVFTDGTKVISTANNTLDNGSGAMTVLGLITAQGGLTASGLITAQDSITTNTLTSTGLITAQGGLTASGLITAQDSITTNTLTSTGLITAQGGVTVSRGETVTSPSVSLTASSPPLTAAGVLSQNNNQLYIGNGTAAVPVGASTNLLTSPQLRMLGG
jgi:hypothetical protein